MIITTELERILEATARWNRFANDEGSKFVILASDGTAVKAFADPLEAIDYMMTYAYYTLKLSESWPNIGEKY